ncbi:hypothetical protein [Methylobacterium oryzae]|uniref:hypothetical protein n=1 Tax=Methylobacterium oryzae TaxID=334852 RepID=UPI002F35E650
MQVLGLCQRHELTGDVSESRAPATDTDNELLTGDAGDAGLERADMADAAGEMLTRHQERRGAEPDALGRDVGGHGVEIATPLVPAQRGQHDDVPPDHHTRIIIKNTSATFWGRSFFWPVQAMRKIGLIPI